MKRWMSFAAVAVAFAFPGLASAATISTLFNTGVDASHAALPNGTSPDPHYTLTSVPGGSSSVTLVRSSAGGFPVTGGSNYFIGDETKSLWIGPDNGSDF